MLQKYTDVSEETVSNIVMLDEVIIWYLHKVQYSSTLLHGTKLHKNVIFLNTGPKISKTISLLHL